MNSKFGNGVPTHDGNWKHYKCNKLPEALKLMINEANKLTSDFIIQLIIEVSDNFTEIDTLGLNKLEKKYERRSAIFFITSKQGERALIYWKTKDVGLFFLLKSERFLTKYEDVYNFVANVLADSFTNEHLGTSPNSSNNKKKISLHSLVDRRNYNLLLLASENGYVNLIDDLLKYGIKPELLESERTAQSLALQNRHYDVLLKLLDANLTFPSAINLQKCSNEVKKFIIISEVLHKMIENRKMKEIENILNQKPNLHYFYNLSNKSALRTALELKSMDVIEFLFSKNLSFAPHEDTNEIYKMLNEFKDQKVYKFLKKIPENHINYLMANTVIFHDENDARSHRELVLRAYETLNSDPNLKIVLRISAATKLIHIIFDFQDDSTSTFEPAKIPGAQGNLFTSGRIIIGAKKLLDPKTEHEIFGTLAHELCHHAMLVVYENNSNPFRENDKETEINFTMISEICKEIKGNEQIILSVYNDYQEENQLSELIVRPAHLFALYIHKPVILEKLVHIYKELFNHFVKNVISTMEKALPEIERRLSYNPTKVAKEKMKTQNQVYGDIARSFVEEHGKFYKLLEREDVKNLKMVVISNIEGPPSFNDILRFLYNNYESSKFKGKRSVGNHINWMIEKADPKERNDTSYIEIWEDIFLHTDEITGIKYGLLLMNVQDDRAGDSRILEFATLFSSILVDDKEFKYAELNRKLKEIFSSNEIQGNLLSGCELSEILKNIAKDNKIFDNIKLVYDEQIFESENIHYKLEKSIDEMTIKDNVAVNSSFKRREQRDEEARCSYNDSKRIKTSKVKTNTHEASEKRSKIKNKTSKSESESDNDSEMDDDQEVSRCCIARERNEGTIVKLGGNKKHGFLFGKNSNVLKTQGKELKKGEEKETAIHYMEVDEKKHEEIAKPKYAVLSINNCVIFNLSEDLFISICEYLSDEDKLNVIFSSGRFVEIFRNSRAILKTFKLHVNIHNFEKLIVHSGLLSIPLKNITLDFVGFKNAKVPLVFLNVFRGSVENLVIKNAKFENFCDFSDTFGKLKAIKHLTFERCSIECFERQILSEMSTLESISFNKCSDSIFEAFLCQNSLVMLSVRNDDWTWTGFPHEIFNKIAENSKKLKEIKLFGAGTGSFFDSDEFSFKVEKLETTTITFHWYVGITSERVNFLLSQRGYLKELTIHMLPFDFDGGRVLKFIIEKMDLQKFYYGKIPLILNGEKQEVEEFEASEIQIQSAFEMFRQFSSIKSFRLTLSATDIASDGIENVINPYTNLFYGLETFEVVDNSNYRSIFGVFLGLLKNLRNIKKFILKTPDRNINVLLEECLPHMTQLNEIYLTSTVPRATERFFTIRRFVPNLKKISVASQYVEEVKRIFGTNVTVCEI